MFHLGQTNIGSDAAAFMQRNTYASPLFGGCRSIILLISCLFVVLLVGCQPAAMPIDDSQSSSSQMNNDTAMPTAAEQEEAADESIEAMSGDAAEESEAISVTNGDMTEETAAIQFLPPLSMAIPALDFAAAVEPMAWQVTEVDGQRQAVWQVPETNAGWHINSAGVGATDNVIISGHHRQGTAVFAPLARGEVSLDDEIHLTDEAGRTYVYQVTEIAQPIPIAGATEAERERLNGYQVPSIEGKLTLLTGWPDFSDTHYLVIVAKLRGELE